MLEPAETTVLPIALETRLEGYTQREEARLLRLMGFGKNKREGERYNGTYAPIPAIFAPSGSNPRNATIEKVESPYSKLRRNAWCKKCPNSQAAYRASTSATSVLIFDSGRTAIIWITVAAQNRNRKDPSIRIGTQVLAVLIDESATIQKSNQAQKNAHKAVQFGAREQTHRKM
ncbi:hypothetical protein BC830DRAFT_1084082 [Chytriomyces sp. MP71]|nr:hypothetical protein BC830DRAFT_1084082 [Chytriomyces sp. MP71]